MKATTIIISIATLFVLTSCSKEPITSIGSDSIAEEVLYFSSFEDETDLDIYEGYAGERVGLAPAGSGEFSLQVAGGCIMPHLNFQIGPYTENKKISLSFQSKTDGGGSLTLSSNVPTNTTARVIVQHTGWWDHEYIDLYELEAGVQLDINFGAGGIAASTMWIDDLKLFVAESE